MSRGRDAHQAHLQAVTMLGKNLTRRAGSLCELCNGADDLRVIEIAPVSESPSEDAAILACAACRDVLTAKRLPKDTSTLRFLEGTVWAEPLPVRVAAIQLLRRLAHDNTEWASQCLESLWIDDDVRARLDA